MTALDLRDSQRQATPAGGSRARRPRPRPPIHKPNEDQVVLIDIDGVLADLNGYAFALKPDGRPASERWKEFFAHIPSAALIDSGHELACAIDSLGFTVTYSTTRPPYTREATRRWLTENGFPPGWALLTRTDTTTIPHPQPAWQTKLAHARAVTNRHPAWLRMFIDDESTALTKLTAAGIPAVDVRTLAGLTVAALRTELSAPTTSQRSADGRTQ